MAAAGDGQRVWRGAPPAGLRLLSLPDVVLRLDSPRHEEAGSGTADERATIEEEKVCVQEVSSSSEGLTLQWKHFFTFVGLGCLLASDDSDADHHIPTPNFWFFWFLFSTFH